MSVNGVIGYSADYSNYDSTAKSAKSEEQAKNSQKNSSGVTYSSKMTDSERAEVVAKLKSDSQRQVDSFKSMVQDMFQKQGLAVKNSDDIWSMLASGNYTVDQATADKAKSLISEDGYWGVDQTSDRIFEMAKALSGGDEEGMNKMFAAFEKGYKQATKSWGRELPDISKQTYDAVQQKFKDYQNSLKSGETEV